VRALIGALTTTAILICFLTACGGGAAAVNSHSPGAATLARTAPATFKAASTAPYVLQHTRTGWRKSHRPRTIRPGHGFTLHSLRWRSNAVARGTLSDSAGQGSVLIHMSHTAASHGVHYYSVLLYQTPKMGDYMRWSWKHRQWEFCSGSC
jgi:hypothetical protein